MHHSALTVTADQYRYLMLGEYVTFELEEAEQTETSSHKWKAANVRGVGGGKLMCESQKQNSSEGRRPQKGGRGPREQRQVGARDWQRAAVNVNEKAARAKHARHRPVAGAHGSGAHI